MLLHTYIGLHTLVCSVCRVFLLLRSGLSVVQWATEMMRDEETSQYVDGMAFHWYVATGQRLMDGSNGWGAINT